MRFADAGDVEDTMTTAERVTNRKIGVIGMARSGIATAILARSLGGEPFVSDSGTAEHLKTQTDKLRKAKIPYETDGHSDRLLQSDYIIISPGVPASADIVKKIVSRGIPIFSEIEFASWVCDGKIIGVTGSNGKTTTTTLIGEIFLAAGFDTFVCGNIGLPFAQVADKIGTNGIAVVEISTFQLEWIADFRPDVALILNLSPDHLDRHGTFEAYKKLKYRITENQSAEDCLALNFGDVDTMRNNITTSANKNYFFDGDDSKAKVFVRNDELFVREYDEVKSIIRTSDIRIPGPHNLQNAAAAILASVEFGIKPETIAGVLRTFAGVEHRLETVDSVAGITFFNDSKATNVDSVCYALRSIDTSIYLIGGGRDKGASYTPLIEHGKGKIKGVILIGEAREKMFEALGREFPTQFADTLEDAVEKCFELARPGDAVLLSPACASFDMFESYEQRGKAFKQAVVKLKEGHRSGETVTD